MTCMQNKEQRDIKIFFAVLGVVAIAVAVWLSYKTQKPGYWVLGAAGVLTALLGWRQPLWLRPMYRAWMFVARIMGWLLTHAVLGLTYYFVVTPLSWLSKALGKRWLVLRGDPEQESYWHYRERIPGSFEDYKQQF
ncbi:MAG TPA: hypothetical protein PKN04_02570 [bacterium]|nr:hypothetical protein [bacterium]HNT64637.1 hypothetical protein [bacterium]